MDRELVKYEASGEFAAAMDAADPLSSYRDRFHIPTDSEGNEVVYFTGNSLGLQPKRTRQYVEQELKDWETLGVEGHLHAKNPWLPYHEFLTEPMSRVVGAEPIEPLDVPQAEQPVKAARRAAARTLCGWPRPGAGPSRWRSSSATR